jgi:AcrR family transcriptional regulator
LVGGPIGTVVALVSRPCLQFRYHWYTNTNGMRRTRAEQQQRTREGVLSAADRLFVERGFHATSVDQIAQAAGYTKGAVYSNFAAKEDLFFAVYERRMERAVRELERTLAAAPDPADWIESVIADTSRRRGRDDRWLSTFFEFWAHVVRRPALRKRFATIHARLEGPFVAALERHADDHQAQPVLDLRQVHLAMTAMTLGLTLERLVRPQVVDGDIATRIARLVLDHLVRGADDAGANGATGRRRTGAAPRPRAGRA